MHVYRYTTSLDDVVEDLPIERKLEVYRNLQQQVRKKFAVCVCVCVYVGWGLMRRLCLFPLAFQIFPKMISPLVYRDTYTHVYTYIYLRLPC